MNDPASTDLGPSPTDDTNGFLDVCEFGEIHGVSGGARKRRRTVDCDMPDRHRYPADHGGLASTDDDIDPTGSPVWSPAEHCRIRHRLLAEHNAAHAAYEVLSLADYDTSEAEIEADRQAETLLLKTDRLKRLMFAEFEWLVQHETQDGHADPHDLCGDLATLTPAPVAEPIKPETPLLGLATTRTLLREIATRAESTTPHAALAAATRYALDALPADVLDYRTVDHR